MTPLGAVTLLAIAVCLKDWRTRFPWLLSATLALPISAAVAVPGLALAPFFLVAVVLAVLLGWDWVHGHVTPFAWPGAVLLLAFVGWSALVTLAGPALFSGIPVLNNRDEADGLVALTTLGYTGSNVAQLAYLGLAVVVICFLATRPTLSLHVFLPGLLGCMTLSFWRLLHDKAGIFFPTALVDGGGDYRYIDIDNDTAYRLRGVFTEPSTLAHYATAAFALSLVMLYTQRSEARPWQRALYAWLAVVSAVNIVFAHSGTALVGGLTVLLVTVVLVTARATRTGHGLWSLSIGACAVVVVALLTYQQIGSYVSELFTDKVGSTSYDQRTTSDTFSLQLLLDTRGLGVGLGSNKPSGLWPMLLSCTGVIGALLFAAFVLYAVARAARTATWLGAAVVATSLVISKSVAGSFLSEPLLMFGLAVCAHASMRVAAGRQDTPAPPAPTPPEASRRAQPVRTASAAS